MEYIYTKLLGQNICFASTKKISLQTLVKIIIRYHYFFIHIFIGGLMGDIYIL